MCLFIGIHLWCQTVPDFVYLFFPLFLSFTSHVSSVDRQPRRTGSFCLFDAFQSNNETSQTPKLDHIRRVTVSEGVMGGRTCSHMTIGPPSSDITVVFSQLASFPNHSARCRSLLSVFNYGMLCRCETIQERCNVTRPTIF